MKLGKLVVNSSPIISLAKIDKVNLLIDLSDELIIPNGVYEEITDFNSNDKAVVWIKDIGLQFIKNTTIPTQILEWNLGKGESEVMSYALHNKFCSVIIDDKPARNCAQVFNLQTYGTLSIIIKAKQVNLIPKVKPLLYDLQSNGFRISDSLVNTILELANEKY